MYGHGRVLPPESRDFVSAKAIARILLVKAGCRVLRDGYYASELRLSPAIRIGRKAAKWGAMNIARMLEVL